MQSSGREPLLQDRQRSLGTRCIPKRLAAAACCCALCVVIVGRHRSADLHAAWSAATGKWTLHRDVVGSSEAQPAAGVTSLASHAGACTAPAYNELTGLPQVQVIGEPGSEPPLDPYSKWHPLVYPVCTPKIHEPPNCTNVSTWEGKVTLCVEGQRIPGVVKIHTRGHSSKTLPKKQFAVKLDKKHSLLGMAEAKKWIIAAPWVDTTFQRNPTAFGLYRSLGGWAPRMQFVSLRWGDQDYGLYYVGEKVEREKGRLDIPKSKKHHPKKSGYLMQINWPDEEKFTVTVENSATSFIVEHPKDPSKDQKSYVDSFLQDVDSLVSSAHPERDLEEVLDFPSLVRYSIVEEIAKNADGFAFSIWLALYDGKLRSAAVWDYDLAFGFDCLYIFFTNIITHEDTSHGVTGWNVENNRSVGFGWGDLGTNKRQFWFNLWKHASYRSAFARTWREQRLGPLSDDAVAASVRQRIKDLEVAAELDIRLWSDTADDRCGNWDCCHREASNDYLASSELFLVYLANRSRWIDENVDKLESAVYG